MLNIDDITKEDFDARVAELYSDLSIEAQTEDFINKIAIKVDEINKDYISILLNQFLNADQLPAAKSMIKKYPIITGIPASLYKRMFPVLVKKYNINRDWPLQSVIYTIVSDCFSKNKYFNIVKDYTKYEVDYIDSSTDTRYNAQAIVYLYWQGESALWNTQP